MNSINELERVSMAVIDKSYKIQVMTIVAETLCSVVVVASLINLFL